MFPSSSSLATTALLALTLTLTLTVTVVTSSPLNSRDVDASSVTTSGAFPFSLKLNLYGKKLPELDRARASRIVEHAKRAETLSKSSQIEKRATNVDVTNTAVQYVANVSIGNPATSYMLLIDTGSSNTWVGANQSYSTTKASKSTGKSFAVSYGSGNVTGNEYTDTLALSSSLVIDQQSIGVATSSNGLEGLDGILGLGPVGLTKGTVSGGSKIPTVVDNLYSQKKISTEVVGISFNPSASLSESNGVMTFGGDDSSKYDAPLTYAPITKKSPAKKYWGYDQTVTYGSSGETVLSSTAGILDTGTTLLLLATDAYEQYQNLTGAVFDEDTGLLTITNRQYQNLQSLYFQVNNAKFELTPNAQIWPRSLNTYLGGTSDKIYLIVNDLGTDSGEGLDFINGYTFLERFYSVYDTTNSRIGLATTSSTGATTN